MLSGIASALADSQIQLAILQLRVIPSFWKSLIAVVTGNLIYFFVLLPYLPPAARHRPNRLDIGLLIDFWVCVVIFAILDLAGRHLGWPRDGSDRT